MHTHTIRITPILLDNSPRKNPEEKIGGEDEGFFHYAVVKILSTISGCHFGYPPTT